MANRYFKGLIILVFIFSCTSKTTHVTQEIIGTYVYEFPSKELAVLDIKNDSTFSQKIFREAKYFHNNSNPLYQSAGLWSVEKENELYFRNWLNYCWLRQPDSILSKPSIGGMSDVYWQKPTKNNNGLISVYEETGYVFKKIKR